jgi:MOSC domain-containing protein YiiM
MPTLTSIAFSPDNGTPDPADHYYRVPAAQARLAVGRGIEGDRKGRHPDRQLNVMGAATLATAAAAGYKTGPGQMGEQLVLDGLDVEALAPGARVQIGAAVIVIIKPRTGCDRFEHIQGLSRTAFSLGQMARVVTAGDIRVGDEVRVVAPVPA